MSNGISAVILGCGGVGQAIAQKLAMSPLISDLTLADIHLAGAESVARRTESEKISIKTINAGDVKQVAELAKDVDVLINGTVPKLNLKVMEGCLRGGASYIDMASGDREFGEPMLEDQFKLSDEWESAGLLALVSMGIDPGASDLFAKRAADRMETVDYVKVRDADTGSLEGYEFATYFAPEAMMGEVLRDPLIWENGAWKRTPSLETSEIYPFPEPIGPMKVFRTDHEETELMPMFIGKKVKNVDFMISLDEAFVENVKVLMKLGLTSREPLNIRGAKVAPFDVLMALMPRPDAFGGKIKGTALVLTEVGGSMNSEKIAVRTWTHISHERAHEISGLHATAYQTGMPVVVATEMLARGEISCKGVKPPEAIDPVKFCDYLPEKETPVFEEILIGEELSKLRQ